MEVPVAILLWRCPWLYYYGGVRGYIMKVSVAILARCQRLYYYGGVHGYMEMCVAKMVSMTRLDSSQAMSTMNAIRKVDLLGSYPAGLVRSINLGPLSSCL